jgi:hypothetical protein
MLPFYDLSCMLGSISISLSHSNSLPVDMELQSGILSRFRNKQTLFSPRFDAHVANALNIAFCFISVDPPKTRQSYEE